MTRFARGTTALLVSLAAGALACSSPTPRALVDARTSYDAVESDPIVARFASVQVYEAKQALDRAETEWAANGDATETTHLAGLASKRVEIARETAEGQQASADAMALLKQKDKVLLEARNREITRVKAQAGDAQRQLQEQIDKLQLEQTERGLLMTLGDVLFDVDQSTLRPGAANKLAALGNFLIQYPDRQLLIEGYTDSTGSDGYNLDLSQRRADAVRDFLADEGVPPSRMIATGYGKAYPKDDNASSTGRQANRRVEATILDPGVQAATIRRTPSVGTGP
jgi:outer membrane protein OmpA-like peptidoglycan-associated protein